MKVRKHMVFSGQVQGVGFRYRAYIIAREIGLTGWVMNLDDGRVEMEVQGRDEEILQLTTRLRTSRWIEITGLEEEQLPLLREKGFKIRN
jgi:acylphosphatase